MYLSKFFRIDFTVRYYNDSLINYFDIQKILKFVQRKYY